jgi:hypothetical protein
MQILEGPPTQGSCRFWRAQQKRLTRFGLELPITSGRNANISGIAAAPAEVGQIMRLLREGAVPLAAHHQPELPPGPLARELRNQREATKAQPRAAKRKLVPQAIFPEHGGEPSTGSQELRRLFARKATTGPTRTQEDFPMLPQADPASGSGAPDPVTQGGDWLGPRTRSRSPRSSAWNGSESRHLEAGRADQLERHRKTTGRQEENSHIGSRGLAQALTHRKQSTQGGRAQPSGKAVLIAGSAKRTREVEVTKPAGDRKLAKKPPPEPGGFQRRRKVRRK